MLRGIARYTSQNARRLQLTTTTAATSTSTMRLMSTQRKSQDPYPNLDIRHAPQMELETPYPNLPPIPRPNEPLEKKRARLIYQSRKRGILETDLLLSTFAQKYLKEFNMEQLEKYDKLLDEPDWDIFYWATDKKKVPDHLLNNDVLDMVRQHAKNENKVVLRMPDLENGQ
ncbi:hypothetical protein INT45_006321 [Circinella minor]|uniref:Succinate dehydrogenase assembly factor 2, mitochondrial n=1 Tax=Circinella minor TaxID=1195481 RepID=A0A8H7RXC3_9FUNG|nr:hypothetical protein INT45_006321 [Circinella minor]